MPPDNKGTIVGMPHGMGNVSAPAAAKNVAFTLRSVKIEGNTAFSAAQLQDLYKAYVGRSVTLDIAWMIAGSITERYRNAGYFLSRAYVPLQKIDHGTITIRVVEGYVAKVNVDASALHQHLPQRTLDRMIVRLENSRPVRSDEIESFLLRLNDMPGLSFRAVLSRLGKDQSAQGGQGDDGVLLTLVAARQKDAAAISFDNGGSRFLGPNELTATVQTSFLPMQRTTLSVLSTVPANELKYVYLQHQAQIAPSLTLDFDGSFTQARPGYTLRPFEIESRSNWLKAGLNWQWIRQRDKNLSLNFSIDGRNTNSDILQAPLTRDRVRAARAGVSYGLTDRLLGYNTADLTISRGLNILGSSEKNDIDLSRAGATPDFTTAQINLTRLQPLFAEISLYGAVAGQIASQKLYTSEEFGYGGKAFGRAYDSSEITGDNGASGALELRYDGLNRQDRYGVQPYGFYDIGSVRQKAADADSQSGSSAGFGIRLRVGSSLSGDFGLAFPLTRPIVAPIDGEAKHGPRPLMQVTASF